MANDSKLRNGLAAFVAGALVALIIVLVVVNSGDDTKPSTATTEPATTTQPATTTTQPVVTSSTSSAATTTAPAGSSPLAAAGSFSEDFAAAVGLSRFDFQLHTSSMGDVPTTISAGFVGEHDMTCGGPTTHRTVHGGQGSKSFLDVSGSELIWYCAPGDDPSKGHMMTALETVDIATLSFSPKETFSDVTRVCWDQNMNNLGEGKWVNVFIVPASDVEAYGGNLNYAAATGLSFGGIDQMAPETAFQFTWLRGSTMAFAGYTQTMDFWKSDFTPPYAGMVPSDSSIPGGPSAPRFTICLNSGGDMVIERPDGTTDTRPLGSEFPAGPVRVIFQDASYNPTKHSGSEDHLTWHWDNISIEAGSP